MAAMFNFKTVQNIVNFIRRKNGYNKLPYSVTDIRDAVEQITNIDRVILMKAEIRQKGIYGQYSLYCGLTSMYSGSRDCVEIMYDRDLNLCWSRLVVCKELCHAILDDAMQNSGQRVTSAGELEDMVKTLIDPEEFVKNPAPTSISEMLALPMALAILCPVEDRERIAAKNLDMTDADTLLEIAEAFKIPERYVLMAFSSSGISMAKKLVS